MPMQSAKSLNGIEIETFQGQGVDVAGNTIRGCDDMMNWNDLRSLLWLRRWKAEHAVVVNGVNIALDDSVLSLWSGWIIQFESDNI